MFTGIIEDLGEVLEIKSEQSNLTFTIHAPFAHELKVDQSVAHNGVCLTVTSLEGSEGSYTVTAIAETLKKTNLGSLQKGSLVNLERCLKAGGRLDGHIVQGHVDTTARVKSVQDHDGSWLFKFTCTPQPGCIVVPRGSVTVNGVSLTVVDAAPGEFSVAIIPYTFDHTNFRSLKPGDSVNIEFDIVGKYIAALQAPYQ